MGEYTMDQLLTWNEKIEKIAQEMGLDFYLQEFEMVDYEEMIACEAYLGMPSQYPHWSFGKNFEKTKTFYRFNIVGLPYEMVINSDPCIAYLMKDNSLLLQVLTMAHVYGHNDFFKNNRLFREYTNAKYTVEMFKNHSNTVRKYIQHPGIGYQQVEKILDAAHAIRYQRDRESGMKSENQQGKKDLISFILEEGKLQEWQKELLHIVAEQSRYFLPQMETKVLNEGWASFWHYKILEALELPEKMHIEFLTFHNRILQPQIGKINPYHLGFMLLKQIEKKYGIKKLFEVREQERDESFIRRYLDQDTCQELCLVEYVKRGKDLEVKEVSNENGWQQIRNQLAASLGLEKIPVIHVVEVNERDRGLILKHEYDGRELQLEYAYETLKHIVNLWGAKVMLKTKIQNTNKIILCDENKNIAIKTDGR